MCEWDCLLVYNHRLNIWWTTSMVTSQTFLPCPMKFNMYTKISMALLMFGIYQLRFVHLLCFDVLHVIIRVLFDRLIIVWTSCWIFLTYKFLPLLHYSNVHLVRRTKLRNIFTLKTNRCEAYRKIILIMFSPYKLIGYRLINAECLSLKR